VQQVAEAVKPEANGQRQGLVPAKTKVIALLTPTLGMVSIRWCVAMQNLIWPMNIGRGFIPAMDQVGNEVGEMRNKLVALSLEQAEKSNNDLEGILWVDDDVIVSKLALLQLVSHDRDIAAGVYFCKGDLGEPLIFAGGQAGTMKFRPDETFEAWGWAQGLSYVRAEVYKRMAEDLDLGKDKYGNPQWYKKPDFGINEITGQMTIGGTEDFHFFANANKLGYRCLVDCSKHAFGWHYDHRLHAAYPRKQWEQFIRREPVVWPKTGSRPEVIWD
jgi:hypothetical protein